MMAWDVCKDVRLLSIQRWDVAVFRPDTCKVPVLPLTAWTFLASFLVKTDIDLLTFKSMDISKVDVIFHDVFISWYWYWFYFMILIVLPVIGHDPHKDGKRLLLWHLLDATIIFWLLIGHNNCILIIYWTCNLILNTLYYSIFMTDAPVKRKV